MALAYTCLRGGTRGDLADASIAGAADLFSRHGLTRSWGVVQQPVAVEMTVLKCGPRAFKIRTQRRPPSIGNPFVSTFTFRGARLKSEAGGASTATKINLVLHSRKFKGHRLLEPSLREIPIYTV